MSEERTGTVEGSKGQSREWRMEWKGMADREGDKRGRTRVR